MTESEMINGWTFKETVQTAENLMKVEKDMFKWDVLRHLRDFAELYREEIQQYRAIGTVEECRSALEKQIPKKSMISYDESVKENWCSCGVCAFDFGWKRTIHYKYCPNCGQKLDWGNEE